MMTCLDIGGSGIKGAVAGGVADIEMLGRLRTPLDDFEAFVGAIEEMLVLSPAPAGSAVSIAITGVVDPADEVIKCANIPCIDGRRLAPELRRRLGRPVAVANDADCFALAEAVAGAGKGHRIVFGTILGTGVGGGLVIDGRMIVGAGGFAGEWGHGPIAATEVGAPPVAIPRFPCGCGQVGCLDTVGAARGMERLHRHLHGLTLDSVEIVAAWGRGDAAASRTIDCYVELVAAPLALVVNVVGAGIVPVGGGLGKSAALIGRLDAEVRKRILRRTDGPLVVQAQLDIEPGLVGAAILGGAS
ncbi:MAG: ROK family protein [Devosia nanyangense]|uniref:N-acetylglucosamine kinase n=1 Tax=Devosia nanyangense TaxID=1228055 RepID=A0A933NXL1_9HYPH|nr:ROK family protein [Devosia nanyangense]